MLRIEWIWEIAGSKNLNREFKYIRLSTIDHSPLAYFLVESFERQEFLKSRANSRARKLAMGDGRWSIADRMSRPERRFFLGAKGIQWPTRNR